MLLRASGRVFIVLHDRPGKGKTDDTHTKAGRVVLSSLCYALVVVVVDLRLLFAGFSHATASGKTVLQLPQLQVQLWHVGELGDATQCTEPPSPSWIAS